MLDQISPLILTWNEEANIGRSLERLLWAKQVVVLDSGSEDRTAEIARKFSNVRFETFPFDHHAAQWNRGIALIDSEWVLSLDADYILPIEFVEGLGRLSPGADTWGYRSRFQYAIDGRILHASLYPSKIVLFRKNGARYRQDGHTQRLISAGRTIELDASIIHDDRKPLQRWLINQLRYADLEAREIIGAKPRTLKQRLRRLGLAPAIVPFYLFVVRGLWRDGRAGLRYILERTIAELLISISIVDLLAKRALSTR